MKANYMSNPKYNAYDNNEELKEFEINLILMQKKKSQTALLSIPL